MRPRHVDVSPFYQHLVHTGMCGGPLIAEKRCCCSCVILFTIMVPSNGKSLGRAGSVTEEVVLSSGLMDGGRWSQDYCIEPRCYLVSVPQLMGILL